VGSCAVWVCEGVEREIVCTSGELHHVYTVIFMGVCARVGACAHMYNEHGLGKGCRLSLGKKHWRSDSMDGTSKP
jgi:hypothetical protein